MYSSSTPKSVSTSLFAKCNFLYDTCDVQRRKTIVPILSQAAVPFGNLHFSAYHLLYLITTELYDFDDIKQKQKKNKYEHFKSFYVN